MKNRCRFCTFSSALFLVAIFFLTGCKTSPPSAPVDTAPTVSIVSPAAYKTCRLTDTVIVNASDDRGVAKVELYINGVLVATATSQPWSFLFNTELLDDGNYTLQAKAYDQPGHVGVSPSVSISILNAFPFTFINNIYTPISITVQGVTLTAQPGDSATFNFSTNPRSVVYTATTSGKTSSGTAVGLTLVWGGSSNSVDVSHYTSYHLGLITSSSYFFLYMRNHGFTTLGPLYVNYGLTDQTQDNISIPQSSTSTYQIGYYRAYTNTRVLAYWSYPNTSTASYWDQGVHFTFPFTTNQYVILTNDSPSSKVGGITGRNVTQTQDVPPQSVLELARIASTTMPVHVAVNNVAVAEAR